MNQKQKMTLFINQPIFFSNHLRKVDEKQFFNQRTLSSIYSTMANVQRFRNLESARNRVAQNRIIDKKIITLIQKLHTVMKDCHEKNMILEKKKEEVLSKLKMMQLKNQLQSLLDKLEQILEKYNEMNISINRHRQEIQKMIKMTQIKKALELQNKMLRQENIALRSQQAAL